MRPAQQNRRMRGRGNNNNNNNNRKGPNPLTRNYESNGPDVKIRGNAQHIAEKYAALARDAQVSGDRVMAENYLQHAEHYNRIILAAMAQNPVPFQREENFGDDMGDDEEGGFVANGVTHQPVNGHGPQPVIEGTPAEVVYGDEGGEQQPRQNFRQQRDNRQPREGRDNRQPREARPYRDERDNGEAGEARDDVQPRDGREQRRFGRDRRPQRERFNGEDRNEQNVADAAPAVAEVAAQEAEVIAAPAVETVQDAGEAAPRPRARTRRAPAAEVAPEAAEAAPVVTEAAPVAGEEEAAKPARRPGRPRRTTAKGAAEEAASETAGSDN